MALLVIAVLGAVGAGLATPGRVAERWQAGGTFGDVAPVVADGLIYGRDKEGNFCVRAADTGEKVYAAVAPSSTPAWWVRCPR